MSLSALVLPTLVAVLLLLVPGGLLSVALGLRGGIALAVAVPGSIALVSVAGILTGFVPLTWGVIPIALVTALGVGVALGFRALGRRFWPHRPGDRGQWGGTREIATYGSLALAAALLGAGLVWAFGAADAFSQTFDNYFHMTVIRSMLDTGNASAFVPLEFRDPGGARTFYPAAWHQLAAFITGHGAAGSIPLAQNALTIATAAIAWPLSLLFLARTAFPGRPILLAATGTLAAGFVAYPYIPISFGVLYPYFLGLAILPLGVAITMQALGLGEGERMGPAQLIAAGGLYIGATNFSHPNAFLLWLATSLALQGALVARSSFRWSRGSAARPTAIAHLAGFVVGLVVVGVLWQVLRPGPWDWAPEVSLAEGLGQLLLGNPVGLLPSLILLVGVLAGIVVLARRPRYAYLLAAALMVGFLWIAAASMQDPDLRDWLVGGFYNDPFRLGSAVPLALFFLILPAMNALAEWSEAGTGRPQIRWSAAGAAVLAALLVIQLGQPLADARVRVAGSFEMTYLSENVTPNELQMLRDLPRFVDEEDVVLVDPKTGAALMYALEGLHPTQYHPNDHPDATNRVLLENINDPDQGPEVCEAVQELGAGWVLDFGTDQINMRILHNPWPGMQRLYQSPILTLTHRVGSTMLYEITGCPG